jgi:TonB family protein
VFFRRVKNACAVVLCSGFVVCGGWAPTLAESAASAQTELTRKVKTKVPPSYPELARRMNIRGTVRVLVVVSPSGSIKEAKAVGGNPILVESAVDALKKWKFEPAPEESTGVVEFRFEDSR